MYVPDTSVGRKEKPQNVFIFYRRPFIPYLT